MREKPVSELEAILATYPDLLWHHCPDSRGCEGIPGMPDFLVVGPRGLIAREAKPHAGELAQGEQVRWRYALIAAGISCNTWIPDDIGNGRVHTELNMISAVHRST